MAELILPTVRLHTAWLSARDEWGRGIHQDGSGLHEGMTTWTPPKDSPSG